MSKKWYLSVFLVISLFLVDSWAFNTRSELNADQLRNVLDSLEMEIQGKRRRGESIDDLVREIETIKLAIDNENLRLKTTASVIKSPQKAKQELVEKKMNIPLPTSLLDWMIVIVGAIALVAFSLLIMLKLYIKIKNRKRLTGDKIRVKPVQMSSKSFLEQRKEPEVKHTEPELPSTPDWVNAMRNYSQQNSDVQNSVELSRSEEPLENVDKEERESTNNLQSEIDSTVPGTTTEVLEAEIESALRGDEPEIIDSAVSESDDLAIPAESMSWDSGMDAAADLAKELLEPLGTSNDEVDRHLKELEKLLEPSSSISSPTEELAEEEPKTRAQQVKEIILEEFDSGKQTVEIARQVGMSVGEIELILTLARRL